MGPSRLSQLGEADAERAESGLKLLLTPTPASPLWSAIAAVMVSAGAIGLPRLRLSRTLLIGALVFVFVHGLYVLGWHHFERKAQSLAFAFGWRPAPYDGAMTLRDGVAYWPEEEGSINGTHPIVMLIKRGRAMHEAQEKKRRRVNSLRRALSDYREAFGMDPPEGFDKWWVCPGSGRRAYAVREAYETNRH